MLIFSINVDIYPEKCRAALEKALEEKTGQKCIVISHCSGVYEVQSEKERLNESGK